MLQSSDPDNAPLGPRPGQYWLFWDGECGFCRRWVQWARARDRADLILPTAYQQVPDPPMDAALARACGRAVHLLHPDGHLERAGQACSTVLHLIGFTALARLLRLRPLSWAFEIGYWVVARNRAFFSRFFFRRFSQFSP
jgi:predicted DCC family thiol-disulfide oxidoreductase YuxK